MVIGYENLYRIIAIDPSTNQTGVAVIEVDLSNGMINIPFTITLKRNDLIRGHKWMAEVHGERETAVYYYGECLRNLIIQWQPSAVAIESPFMFRRPQAFKALTEIVTTFRNIVMSWDVTVPVEFVDPPTVKKTMGVRGNSSDKEDMRVALINSPLQICLSNGIMVDDMDEHQIDAVSVGIWLIKHYQLIPAFMV